MSLAADALRDYAAYRARRSAADLYSRALFGPPFYIVGIVAIWAVGSLHDRLVLLLALAIIVFAALWLARWRNALPPSIAPLADFERWKTYQWRLINAGYAMWSLVMLALGAYERQPTTPVVVGLVATVAYTSAGTATFNTDDAAQRRMLVYLLLPGLVGLAFATPLRPMAFAYLAYWLYAYASARNFRREYELRMHTEFELLRSRADLETLARTDALTQLWNRREYDAVFERAWHQHQRDRQPLSLLVIDLDHFKRLNDQHGHLVGDECLRHVARLLQGSFRRTQRFRRPHWRRGIRRAAARLRPARGRAPGQRFPRGARGRTVQAS